MNVQVKWTRKLLLILKCVTVFIETEFGSLNIDRELDRFTKNLKSNWCTAQQQLKEILNVIWKCFPCKFSIRVFCDLELQNSLSSDVNRPKERKQFFVKNKGRYIYWWLIADV